MRVQTTYADSSVFGGVFDDEFAMLNGYREIDIRSPAEMIDYEG